MLIDDILSKRVNNVFMDWEPMKLRLMSAEKFELAPDFAATAEELAMNFDVIANAIPFCRLPYTETWIEVAQKVRPRYSFAPIHVPGVQKIPSRVGFLLSAQSMDLSAFKAHQFWMIDGECFASHLAMEFEPEKAKDAPADHPASDVAKHTFFKISSSPEWYAASGRARAITTAVVRPIVTDYRTDHELSFARTDSAEYGKFLLELGSADWSGEAMYLLGVLALLNTVNAVETTKSDLTKLNKQRSGKNRPPLQNYYTLAISPRLKARMPKEVSSSHNAHYHLRAHMVRGHWKVRKSGIYFWKPFMRGGKGGGSPIDKRYKVK